jgi:hypothetical protein
MDRDDARDMQDMLMEDIVDVNDPNIDWDNYSNNGENGNNRNIKINVKKINKEKTRMEKLKDYIADEFKQFVIENSQTDEDKKRLLSFIDKEIETNNKILSFNEYLSESISRAIHLDLRITYLLKHKLEDTMNNYEEAYKRIYYSNDGFKYTIKNETEFNTLLACENLLINKLKEKFTFVYGKEYFNRIYSDYNFRNEDGELNRLCTTIENIRKVAKYEFVEFEDGEVDF